MSADQPSKPNKKTKPSKVEVAKQASNRLRGTLADTLASDATHFSEDEYQLLKFHGVYQQDDRDTRGDRKDAGLEPDYSFMIRCTIPGGILTADQYLRFDELADECANGSLRLTTRQSVQFHGVYKPELKALIAGLNEKLVTTLAACGDVERNVMASPAPLDDEAHRLAQQLAVDIAVDLRPATGAYHEIWLGGEKVVSTQPKEEPFYGETYLPRKFKTGVALATDNSIDVYSYDCGLVVVVEDGRVVGCNLVIGGGFGMNHTRADTMATLAKPIAFVAPEHAVEAVRTVAAVFRDRGDRADRKHARLKYLIAERGLDWFVDEFKARIGFAYEPPRELPRPGFFDYLGKHPQAGGKHFYGVFVPSGRIIDRDSERIRTALRTVIAKHKPGIRLTPNQNLLLTDLDDAAIDDIEQTLRAHGVRTVGELSLVRRHHMSCPALPTCGLALTESERAMPAVVDAFEQELAELGLEDEPLTLRMTGCPNGCARPYTADISFVGRKPGRKYNIYVGGGLSGDRLADLYAEDVSIDDFATELRPLLKAFVARRRPEEGFSDFYQRLRGGGAPRERITGREKPVRDELSLEVAS